MTERRISLLLTGFALLVAATTLGFALSAGEAAETHRLYVAGIASDSAPSPTPVPPATPAASGFQVVFIDVGQGDAELITVNGQRLLIDGGRSGGTIVQRLQALGVTDLDAVIATHPDADHAGGLTAVLNDYQVERIYVNGDPSSTDTYSDFLAAAAAEPGAQTITPVRGQTIALGALQLPVLHPPGASGDTNNDSIVLRLTCGSVSVLFTGDAEIEAEQGMIAAGLATPVTVLKVGHHGSNSSSSVAFLQALAPKVAVISAGRTNPYGHPTAQTLTRLASVGAQFVYTDTTAGDDSVTMTSDCTSYSFSTVPTSATPSPSSTTTTSTATPTFTTATALPTATSASAYQLPACYVAGANTCNCADFSTHGWAQWFHDTYDAADVNRLDADHDGSVCETLPG